MNKSKLTWIHKETGYKLSYVALKRNIWSYCIWDYPNVYLTKAEQLGLEYSNRILEPRRYRYAAKDIPFSDDFIIMEEDTMEIQANELYFVHRETNFSISLGELKTMLLSTKNPDVISLAYNEYPSPSNTIQQQGDFPKEINIKRYTFHIKDIPFSSDWTMQKGKPNMCTCGR